MSTHIRRRFWFESVGALTALALSVLTLINHEWLELFGIEPDGGNGAAEWLLIAVALATTFVLGMVARREFRYAGLTAT